jgi:hypothetical protein
MLEAFYDWVAARSPKYRAMEDACREMDSRVYTLERDLSNERARRIDCMTDIAWLQAEIQKVNVPLGTLRKAIASTSPDFSATQEIIRVDYPLDLALARVLPIPFLVQKIAEAMLDASLAALANRFQMPDGVRGSWLPASGKSEGV